MIAGRLHRLGQAGWGDRAVQDAVAVASAAGMTTSKPIQEFEVDLLLEEEFQCEPSFAKRFLATCAPGLRFERVFEVARSRSDNLGETDLLVRIDVTEMNDAPLRVGLLIEDKISAGFQPQQAERYMKRGEAGLQAGEWQRFITVLVAPEAYVHDGHGFQSIVTLQQLMAWICPGDPLRREFRVAKLKEAIKKQCIHGVQQVDEAMTSFRKAYYNVRIEFNARRGTDFEMRAPAPTYDGDNWFILRSKTLPKWSYIRHMGVAGNVDLTFTNTNVAKADGLRPLLDADMTLLATGKHHQHSTVRIPVTPIPKYDDFEDERMTVMAALLTAERLWRLFQRQRTAFDSILLSAHTPAGVAA